MTTNLQELKQKRLKWVEANRENGFDEGINRLLTELYPDNAHFIYELLQNAEDPKATQVSFNLTDSAVEFEHDGERLFTIENVESITSIGNSTKRDDATSIGKFGVGFKAVFAYTNTPEIHSGEFHFRIIDLVVPEISGVSKPSVSEQKTHFIFPFDNPKKPPTFAVKEVETGLRNLGDNTLLFLSHIRKIEYKLPNGGVGSLQRTDHNNGRIEIESNHPGGEKTISHWLHFHKDVEVIDDNGKPKTCRIAIAYQLEQEMGKSKDQTAWKIVSVNDGGQVSIYFPAEKETSKLRFHLHAPFASTVARDSVRDCQANEQLRDHLANLVVESLANICKRGLLTMNFLAVLPNPRDSLAKFYEPIRQSIVDAFNNQPLTPTKRGSYAKAEGLYRGLVRITDVISDDDLSLLTNNKMGLWAANPPQRNQPEDNFLDSLAIKKWEFEHLSDIFQPDEREKIEPWLGKKDDVWLMSFYTLLNEAKENYGKGQERLPSWQRTNWPGLIFPLVRVDSTLGVKHVVANQAFFAPEDKSISPPSDIDIVRFTVYAKDKTADGINQSAKTFLQNIGVKQFDNKAAIESRLKHYQSRLEQTYSNHYEDIKQFINYWKKNPLEQGLFKNQTILLGISDENKLYWSKPDQLCLDKPYLETGLTELTTIHGKRTVWRNYYENLSESQLVDFVEFLKATGVMTGLVVVKVPLHENPYSADLWKDCVGGGRTSVYEVSEDYSVAELNKFLDLQSIRCSLLLWDTLINAEQKVAKARYRPNSKHRTREADSQLVHHLKNHAWIPNKQGDFCKPQDMSRDDLRDDFPFNNGNGLLTAIGFSENARKRSEEYQAKNNKAQEIGFESAERAAKWAELDRLGISPDELLAQQKRAEQPEESVPNPDRRRKGVLERSENAPSKESVMRERSIQPGIANILAEAKAYLRAKNTNPHGEMVCQCCQYQMPFKIGDAYYFEAVQCVKEMKNHHIENRLALCPTCAAMYQHARETDDSEIRRLIVDHEAPDNASSVEIPVTLAGKQHNLRFVGTHWFDLKTVLEN